MGRTGGEEPGQAGAGDRPGDGTESGQRRLRSRGMPSRTRAEGTASGPLPPAVGRGHRALGWKGASPPHSSVLQGGAFSGTPPPPVSLARCSQNARPAGSREGTGGRIRKRNPRRGARMSVIRSIPAHPWHGWGTGSGRPNGGDGGRGVLRVPEPPGVWGSGWGGFPGSRSARPRSRAPRARLP